MPSLEPAYRNSRPAENDNLNTPADILRTLMVAIHQITPELADYHIAQMCDLAIADQLELYRRSIAALKLLARIRRQDPELWQWLRKWAEEERRAEERLSDGLQT